MKRLFTLLLSCFFAVSLLAQYTTKTFTYGGVARKYILYIPGSYDGSQQVPFILALHGLGDNMTNFRNGINLKPIADTANFIFAVPQALVDPLVNASAWNSGAGAFGFTLNAGVDDVGFLNAIIDSVSLNYSIDQKRLFATGFSMGGFMSNRLACELNGRIAAIASVSGTIGAGLNCKPLRAIATAHFHGNADSTVLYDNNAYGTDAEETSAFWVNNNNCDTTAIIDSVPDIANDGKNVIHYKSPNGAYGTEVEFFKVIGGGHTWLTAANDINYSKEIWNFFSKHSWQEQANSIRELQENNTFFNVYPNPVFDNLNIEAGVAANYSFKIFDVIGKKLNEGNFSGNTSVNFSVFNKGILLLSIFDSNGVRLTTMRIIK